MSNKETDILQIRKYLNGELDARAMHRLERRAQDDPFLMDALEGYEKAGRPQNDQLADITRRLNERTSRKERKLIPFNFMAIAASVLIIFTVGGLWLLNKKGTDKRVATDLEKVAVMKPAPVSTIDSTPKDGVEQKAKPVEVQPMAAARAPKAKQARAINTVIDTMPGVVVLKPAGEADKMVSVQPKDSTPAAEMIVLGMESASKKRRVIPSAAKDTSPNTLLTAKAEGLNKTTSPGRMMYNPINTNLIQGRVLASDGGQPLAGASIRVAGTNKTAVTDMNGKFSIPFDSSKRSNLVIASIGYQTRQVSPNRDSLKNIALEPNNNSLSEVVVVDYGTKKKTAGDTIPAHAHPRDGWAGFRKYLRNNAISPDGRTGTVHLTVRIDHDGTVNAITVIKSLSPAADKKAIDMLSNGPQWIGNTNGLPEKVTIRVPFKK